jgi:replicative DNA helicase
MKTDLAEAGLLTVAFRPERTAEVLSLLRVEDFSETRRPVYATIKTLFDRGEAIDLVTVAQELERTGYPTPVEAVEDLLGVLDHSCAANLPTYAKNIRQGALYRNLNVFLGDARETLMSEEPEAAYQRIMARLTALAEQGDNGVRTMKDVAKEYIAEMHERAEADGQLIGLSTGFAALDDRMGGMRPGDLIVIAGRPGMGKTTLAVNILDHNAIKQRRPALMFSLEMSATQIMEKQTAALGEISIRSLRGGLLNREELDSFANTSKLITNGNLVIDERGGLSLAQIRARCFEVQRRYGLEIVGIDYLQLMNGEGENRNQIISDITRGLKQLAKDLKCPVIVLSQLNRGVESRTDKRPRMSDLRESGAIEQDADAIVFPYRDEYYDEKSRWQGIAQIIFGKLRMGEVGSEGLGWEGQYSRFSNLNYRPDFTVTESTSANKKKERGFTL